MLKITQNQVKQFEQYALINFCKDMLDYLNEHFSEKMSDIGDADEQLDWVKENVDKAAEYNITVQGDIRRFLNVAITFGENFDELPWANSILNEKLEPSTRTRMLQDAVVVQLDLLLSAEHKQRNELIEQKIQLYVSKKTAYVVSCTVFNGLPFNKPADAPPWLEAVARRGIAYGFIHDILLDSYLDTAIHFGADFHQEPWATNILNSKQSTHEKVSALLDHLSHDMTT